MDLVNQIGGWFTSMGPDQMMGAGSAIVAFISAAFSWRTMRRQERREATSLKLAHDSDIIRWSDAVILELAEAHEMLCEKGVSYPDGDFPQRRSAARARISALIDRGRLFFPNTVDKGGHGAEKELAYQGHRQPALEALVRAHDALNAAGLAPGPDKAALEAMTIQRRAFITEVFKAVDPVRRGMTLKELSA